MQDFIKSTMSESLKSSCTMCIALQMHHYLSYNLVAIKDIIMYICTILMTFQSERYLFAHE